MHDKSATCTINHTGKTHRFKMILCSSTQRAHMKKQTEERKSVKEKCGMYAEKLKASKGIYPNDIKCERTLFRAYGWCGATICIVHCTYIYIFFWLCHLRMSPNYGATEIYETWWELIRITLSFCLFCSSFVCCGGFVFRWGLCSNLCVFFNSVSLLSG